MSNVNLHTDFQTLVPSSGGVTDGNALVTVFEVELKDIGGVGVDKLYFHNDSTSSGGNIQWYSLINETNYGSTTSSDYQQVSYTAFPVEADGFEYKGTGSLPRPTIKFANINAYWNTYLTNFDGLLGAKIIRRKTLRKYLTTNPPVELNREIYYIERKASENGVEISFELASAFDVEKVKLPRRTVIAARCPWKYQDTDQGGCDWPNDNEFTINGVAYILYFDKENTQITLDTTDSSYTENTYNYWGLQNTQSNRTTSLYAAKSYAVDQYAEYQRPVGDLFTVTSVTNNTNATVYELSTSAHGITVGDYVIAKSTTNYDYKQVPLYVTAVSGANITVEDDNSATGSYTASSGFLQLTRRTLFRCIAAHSIATSDSVDDLIRPTNISYWKRGDICGNWPYLFAYHSPEQFNKQYLIALRDSLGKAHVGGAIPQSFMAIETLYDPDYLLVKEKPYTIATKGLWTMVNDFLGGPYTAYAILDEKKQKIIYVEGFIYCPGERKRAHIFELEAILSGLKLN